MQCPACGHTFTSAATKAASKVRTVVPDPTMLDSADATVRAKYYALTAAAEDARFYARAAERSGLVEWQDRFTRLAGELEGSPASLAAKKRQVFAMIDQFRIRDRPVEDHEDLMWLRQRYLLKRERAKAYRVQITALRRAIYHAAFSWQSEEAYQDAYDATVACVRAARELIPHAPMFTSES